jgi:hypothetical protein
VLVTMLAVQASRTVLGNILVPTGQMVIETLTARLRASGYYYLTVIDPPGPIVDLHMLVLPLIASVIIVGLFVSLTRLVILWKDG